MYVAETKLLQINWEEKGVCKKSAKKEKNHHQVHKHIKHLIFSREFSKPDANRTQFTQH